MRTTVDIPDPIYRELKTRAAVQGKTVKELILHGVRVTLEAGEGTKRRRRGSVPPVLESRKPGSLKLGKEGVYEYIPFP